MSANTHRLHFTFAATDDDATLAELTRLLQRVARHGEQ
jgi:hypothetical protein